MRWGIPRPRLVQLKPRVLVRGGQQLRHGEALKVEVDSDMLLQELKEAICEQVPETEGIQDVDSLKLLLDDAALASLQEPWMYLGLAFPSAKDPAWGDEKAGGQPELESVSTAVVIAEVPTGWFDGWAATRVHARGGVRQRAL